MCDGPDARLDAGRRTALCTPCERAGPAGREPVRLGDILTAAGGVLTFAAPDRDRSRRTACRFGGTEAERHRTTAGRRLPKEPAAHPVDSDLTRDHPPER